MRSGRLWLLLCALSVATGARLTTAGPAAPDFSPDRPLGLMRRFEAAYQGRRLDLYADLFTRDFRFFFSDPENAARYPEGWQREDEIAAADHLFHGFVDARGISRPAAERIELEMEPFLDEADPEHADSAAHYRRFVVPSVVLRVWTRDGSTFVENQRHDFYAVRGDAAALPPGLEASPDRWYIRKWVENPKQDAAPVATRAGDPDRVDALPWGIVGILPNPSRGEALLVVRLRGAGSATLTLVDVAGRVRVRRALDGFGPGEHRVPLPLGPEIGSGSYWAVVTEGTARDRSRLVVLR